MVERQYYKLDVAGSSPVGPTMIEDIPPDQHIGFDLGALPDEWLTNLMHDVDETIAADNRVAKEKRKRIERFAENIVDKIQDPEDTMTIAPHMGHIMEVDHPHDVPNINYDKKFGGHEPALKIYTDIGGYYVDRIRDVTNSEAFNTGFHTAVAMIRAGIITIDQTDTGKETEDDDNTND